MDLHVDTSVSKEGTASVFRDDGCVLSFKINTVPDVAIIQGFVLRKIYKLSRILKIYSSIFFSRDQWTPQQISVMISDLSAENRIWVLSKNKRAVFGNIFGAGTGIQF